MKSSFFLVKNKKAGVRDDHSVEPDRRGAVFGHAWSREISTKATLSVPHPGVVARRGATIASDMPPDEGAPPSEDSLTDVANGTV